MTRKTGLVLTGVTVLALFCLRPIRSARADDLDAAAKERIAKAETGAATIDVSKYPPAMQERYPIFARRCAQCHRISRAINSDYALPDEWERYIKRMMHKPGSGIDKEDGKKIYEFLVYDTSVRKKDVLQKKLGALPDADRVAAEAKIKEVTDSTK